MTWLGILNFAVLQWFGIRLGRWWEFRVKKGRMEPTTPGWILLVGVWPLTGWWSDYTPQHPKRIWLWRPYELRDNDYNQD